MPSPRHPLSTSVTFRKLHESVQLPKRETEGSAGADLRACLPDGAKKMGIAPGARELVPCGFAMALDSGFEAQVRPRSGLAIKHGVTVLNSPGTIDSDYRGEVKVILINHGDTTFIINDGDRIAQMVICAIPRTAFHESETLGDTERGEGGFGSTGAA